MADTCEFPQLAILIWAVLNKFKRLVIKTSIFYLYNGSLRGHEW
jgi:hypothetical protein